MENTSLKKIIYLCIDNILKREKTDYTTLNKIYKEVSEYLEVENNTTLQSQIRGRLQENCEQYSTFKGESLFLTEKVRSGKWTIKKDLKKYIRYYNNKYLITDDNWQTIKEVKCFSPDYILDEDQNNNYKAKLTYEIGIDKAKLIINELNKIKKILKNIPNSSKTDNNYGNEFEVFAISALHNIEYEECIKKYIIHGSKDGKIDAIYYGKKEEVYVYQIKLTDIDDTAYDIMRINYDKCCENTIPKDGDDLYNFIKENKDKWKDKKVVYKSVSKNSKKAGNSTPESIYDMFFKNKLLPTSNNNLVLEIKKPKLNPNSSTYNISTDGNKNFSFYIKAIELKEYLLNALGINPENYEDEAINISKYFSDNVRGVLKTNKKMIYTIENEPENFIKYNNGINITGDVKDLTNKIQIKNPTINNGQQTITTLLNINKNLDKIMLSVKITNETDMIIKGKISQYSNEQVKVKAIDMLSLNQHIRNIQTHILENEYNKNNYFLEIYSSGKKEYEKMRNALYKKNNIINLLDFVKLYFSVKDSKNLGAWKNNPGTQVEKTIIDDDFNKALAFKVCEATSQFNDFIDSVDDKKDKDDFKSADLAFKYLICKENLTIDNAAMIIKRINKKYFYDLKDGKSKLIDIYKSTTIIKKIEEELKQTKNKTAV